MKIHTCYFFVLSLLNLLPFSISKVAQASKTSLSTAPRLVIYCQEITSSEFGAKELVLEFQLSDISGGKLISYVNEIFPLVEDVSIDYKVLESLPPVDQYTVNSKTGEKLIFEIRNNVTNAYSVSVENELTQFECQSKKE